MTLAEFYDAAVAKAQAGNASKSWDYFFDALDAVYAWEEWIDRK